MGRSADWDDEWDRGGGRGGRDRVSEPRGGRLSSSQVSSALREAQQLQQEGQLEEAIELCEDLMNAGVERSDARYFLGWLYQEAERWEDAADQFQLLLADPDFALSCYYALGQCARARGNIEEAAQYFDEAVDRVNLDALTRDESDQLLQLCQEAAEAHREMGDAEGTETVYNALLGFLRSRGWQDQVDEVERLMGESGVPAMRRRRPTGGPQQRPGGNIPQRPRGSGNASLSAGARAPAGPPPAANAAPAAPAASPQLSSAMPALTGASMAVPAASGPMGAVAGRSSANVMGDAYGGGYNPAASGVGMGGMGGMGGPDPLADLISSLSGPGMGPGRSGMPNLPEPQRAQVAAAVRDIGNYVAHGLLTAAIEECLRVIELAPQYLDVHLMLGEIYVRQGKIEQAIAKYAILVDTYLVNGRVDDAIATYRRILQLEPNNLTYRVKLIELLSRQGRIDEVLHERMSAADSYLRLGYADRAIQEYEQALLANPNNLQVRLNYAHALMKAGRGPQAIGEYQRILTVDPSNVQALSRFQIALGAGIGAAPGMMGGPNAGRAAALDVLSRLLKAMRAEGMRSYDEVVREYLQALETSPANADMRYALGQIYLLAGRHQEALTSFRQLANMPGMEVLARYGAGQALVAANDPGSAMQAVADLEEASQMARMTPPEPTVWAARPRNDGEERLAPEIEISMLLARAYQLAGKIDQVQRTLQTVKDQRPYSDEVYRALAEVSAKQGDTQAQLREYAQLVRHYRNNRMVENAITMLREMAKLAPDDPSVRTELADIHIQRGLLDEGLSELKQLADIHTRKGQLKEAAGVFQHMAEISWDTGKHDEAINLLYQAVGYAAEDMSLRRRLVEYCLLEQRTQEAAQQQAHVAEYYYKSRQTKEAVEALQQLIALDKSNLDAYEMLGQTYASVGEYLQAERVYRNLARLDPSSELARARLAELQSVRARMG